jgi:hypothetical protein
MKPFLLFLFSSLLFVGCATSDSRYQSAENAYLARLLSSQQSQPRVSLKVPDGTELKGGFELIVSDPNTPLAPMDMPESDFQTGIKSVMKALPFYWGAVVANNAVNRPPSVIQGPTTVVRPEIITVPAE